MVLVFMFLFLAAVFIAHEYVSRVLSENVGDCGTHFVAE